MYKVKVNGKYEFNLNSIDGIFSLDGKTIEIDAESISNNSFHVIYKTKSFRVELIEKRKSEKTVLLKINSNEYLIEVADQYDELLHKLGFDKAISNTITQVKAPMPGLVLNILVKEGDTISKGDNIIILEAMKMENIIKSPVDGIVKNIKVSIGDKLEKNQLMANF